MRSGLLRPLAALALGGWLGSAAIAQQPPPSTGPAPAPAPAPAVEPAVAPMTPDGASHGDGCYADVEYLLWRRNMTRRFLGFVDNNGNAIYDQTDLTLETSMMHFDFESGVRGRIGYQADSGFGGEVVGMGLEKSHATMTINATINNGNAGNIISPVQFENSPPFTIMLFPFDSAKRYDVDYTSRLDGGEINGTYTSPTTVGTLTFLVGFRYLTQHEAFTLAASGTATGIGTDAPIVGHYDVHTDNDLFGAQVGIGYNANLAEGLRLELCSKFGLFDNFARQGQAITNGFLATGAPVSQVGSASSDRFANLVEFGLFLHWWCVPHFGVNVGYQGMFINNLALAPKQLNFSLDPHAHSLIDMNADVFYHGLSAGFEFRW